MARPYVERFKVIAQCGLLRDEVPLWMTLPEIRYAASWARARGVDFSDGIPAALSAVGPGVDAERLGKRKFNAPPPPTIEDIGGYVEAMIRKQKLDKEYAAKYPQDD